MRTTGEDARGAGRGRIAAAGIAVLVVAASLWAAVRVEADLTTRSRAALAAAGIPAAVSFHGRDATLVGAVSSGAQAADAIGVVAGVAGARHVTSHLGVAAADGPPTSGGLQAGDGSAGPSATAAVTATSTVTATPGVPGSDPSAEPAEPGADLPRGALRFATDDATLSAGGRTYLDQVASFLAGHPQLRLVVQGYADDSGTDEANWAISERRATVVAQYLQGRQVAPNRLRVQAFAATTPLAPNDTPEGRAANRRVELVEDRS